MRRIFLVIVAGLIAMPCFASDELYFVGVENVAPFAYEEDGVIKGYDYEIFMEVMRRMGQKVRVELLPFKRSWNYLVEGIADGTFMIYHRKDREAQFVYCLTPIHTGTYHLFVRKGYEFPFQEVRDLYGKRVANQSAFFVSPEFQVAVKQGKIILDEALSIDMNLKKLMAGRVDCYISSIRLIRSNLKKLGFEHKVVPLEKPIVAGKGLYMALGRKGRRVVDKEGFVSQVAAILAEMDKDGTRKKIDDTYFPE